MVYCTGSNRLFAQWAYEGNVTKTLLYRVILRPEPEGGYTALVPSLPGCITYGADVDDAIAMAREAIELYVESLIAHGDEVPNEEGTLEYALTVTYAEVAGINA